MIKKSARTNLTADEAKERFEEAQTFPGAVAELIEQDNGRFTVTIVFDDGQAVVDATALSGFEKREAAPAAALAATAAATGATLGSLSERFESNGKPGAIGHDSTGGFSYGQYQIATRTGTMSTFMSFLQREAPALFTPLRDAGGADAAKAGTAAFQQAWRALAANPAFARSQHDFIQATHYAPLVTRLKGDLALDAARFSIALNNVIWSVGVQHGPGNQVFHNALADRDLASMTERQIIEAVYDERSNVGRYFSRSTAQVREAVLARFKEERRLAIAMIV